jgi:hypothetical protein
MSDTLSIQMPVRPESAEPNEQPSKPPRRGSSESLRGRRRTENMEVIRWTSK